MTQINMLSKYIKTDVTVIKFSEDYLYAAIGNNLLIYDLDETRKEKLIINTPIFHGQKIHGLVFVRDNEFIIYGGKQIKICSLNNKNNKHEIVFNEEFLCDDWILCLTLIGSNLLIVTAHNVLLQINRSGISQRKITCYEKCILYSALLCKQADNDMINNATILGGTVFSDVIVWQPKKDTENIVLHRLKGHKGVIFSIAINLNLRIITTTSDDRSVRLWSIKSSEDTIDWANCSIVLQNTVFGHIARVRQSIIIQEAKIIVSVGEDGLICVWDLLGTLLGKKSGHQSCPIWGLDCSYKRNLIATGGSDGGILLHELLCLQSEGKELTLPFVENENATPRRIVFMETGSIICIRFNGDLIYRQSNKYWTLVDTLPEMKSYCLMDSNKERIILAGLNGCIRIYEESKDNLILLINTNIIKNRILSVHINYNFIVVCSENGFISCYRMIVNNNIYELVKSNTFVLPKSKERCVTCILHINDCLIVGDRRGNIHIFGEDGDAIQTLTNAHSYLGVTSLNLSDKLQSILESTGRDGIIKKYKFNDKHLLSINSDKLPMDWIEKIISFNNINLAIGFLGSNFILWSYDTKEIVLEINCGGGHRSWDVNIVKDVINFVYIKHNLVYEVKRLLLDILKPCLEYGYHTKEINTLVNCQLNETQHLAISAGEDTTIRVNYYDTKTVHPKFKELSVIQSHVSNVRALTAFELTSQDEFVHSYLLFSAGGRAQLCVSKIDISQTQDEYPSITNILLSNNMLKGTDKIRKNKNWKDFKVDINPETRYMDICVVNLNNKLFNLFNYIIIAGCSDGILRVFQFSLNEDTPMLQLIGSFKFHKKCILKVHCFQLNKCFITLTMCTDGTVSFWNMTKLINLIQHPEVDLNDINELEPCFSLKLHQNGINSFDLKELKHNIFLLSTGGDDNKITLSIIEINTNNDCIVSIRQLKSLDNSVTHCTQITGVKIILPQMFLLTTSIDQRISVFKFDYCIPDSNLSADVILNLYLQKQYCSTVADIQGMELCSTTINMLTVCLYGKGVELLEITQSN